MGYTGKRLPDDLVYQVGQDLKLGIPDSISFPNLTVISGASLPAFDSLVVKTSGTSQLGTVIAGAWQGSGVTETYGGTGQTSYTPGDILYSDATNSLAVLASGSAGQVLKIAGGALAWGSAPSSNVLNSITLITNVTNTDRFVMISGAPGAPTVNLPTSPNKGQEHNVKDRGGTASTSGITIDGNGKVIDGLSTSVISANYGSTTVVWDGAQWSII